VEPSNPPAIAATSHRPSERLVAAREALRRFALKKITKRSHGRYLVIVFSAASKLYDYLGPIELNR
jgi:hypothetical protein